MKHYDRRSFQATQGVGFFLNRARNIASLQLDRALKPLDITGQHMGILLSLQRGFARTPLELCKLLGIDTGLMTRTLDKLERKGLLVRSRSAEDRRVVNLELTSRGQQLTDRIPDIAVEVLNERLRHFSRSEFKEFIRLLKKFGD